METMILDSRARPGAEAATPSLDADLVAPLHAASVQASALDFVGAVAALDFRNRPWNPGQANRFAAGDRLVLDAVLASVRPLPRTATLAMLAADASPPHASAAA